MFRITSGFLAQHIGPGTVIDTRATLGNHPSLGESGLLGGEDAVTVPARLAGCPRSVIAERLAIGPHELSAVISSEADPELELVRTGEGVAGQI